MIYIVWLIGFMLATGLILAEAVMDNDNEAPAVFIIGLVIFGIWLWPLYLGVMLYMFMEKLTNAKTTKDASTGSGD